MTLFEAQLRADRFAAFEFANQASFHPFFLAMVLLGMVLVLVGPRRHAVGVAIFVACLTPHSQRVIVGGLAFQPERMIAVAAIIRALALVASRPRSLGFPELCIALISGVLVFATVLKGGAWLPMAGQSLDFLGFFFLARVCWDSRISISVLSTWLQWAAVICAVLMCFERWFGTSVLSVIGIAHSSMAIRGGEVRAAAMFAHPILAGVWWAAALPLVLANRPRNSIYRWVAAGSAVYCIYASSSSTPLACGLTAALLLAIYRWRLQFRHALLLIPLLVAIHFASQSGLHGLLFTKFPGVANSTGFHRYLLIDAAINHIGEWWAVGALSTAHWGRALDDVTNQYLWFGIRGGMVALLLAVGVFVYAIVSSWKSSVREQLPMLQRNSYAVFASLMVHGVAFLAVTYFGQVISLFAATLGCALGIAAHSLKTGARQENLRMLGDHQQIRGQIASN